MHSLNLKVSNTVRRELRESRKVPIDPEYPRIEDHGVLLNNRTAALVSKFGEVDFACFPNFDSQMVFSSILDRKKGGYFSIRPLNKNLESRQFYEPDTNILHTLFTEKRNKVVSIMDFLPMNFEHSVYFSEIHRRIETYADVNMEVDFSPFISSIRKSVEKTDGKQAKSTSPNFDTRAAVLLFNNTP